MVAETLEQTSARPVIGVNWAQYLGLAEIAHLFFKQFHQGSAPLCD